MTEQKLRLTLITARTVDEGVGKESGKGTKVYYDTAAVCFLDAYDMKKLGIKNGTHVRVTTKYGSVIVKCKKWPRGTMVGLLFMPCGLWANAVCGDDTYSVGIPMFKGFPVEIEPAPDEPVLTLDELMKEEFGR